MASDSGKDPVSPTVGSNPVVGVISQKKQKAPKITKEEKCWDLLIVYTEGNILARLKGNMRKNGETDLDIFKEIASKYNNKEYTPKNVFPEVFNVATADRSKLNTRTAAKLHVSSR